LNDRFIEGVVIQQKEWSPTLRSLFIKAKVEPFIAGQFTQLALPDAAALFRPYSFVNAPMQATLEFYYSVLSAGNLSQKLARLMPGDRILVAKRPSGRFVLAYVPDAEVLWLFATGTGLGVFLSMLKTPEPWHRFKKIVLVHSVQKEIGLTHFELREDWQRQYGSQFHFIPIVTGDKQSSHSSLRVTELLATGELEKRVGVSLSANTSQTMLCGNPAMVNDLSQLLMLRGLDINQHKQPGHITVENYWKLGK